LPFGPPQSVPQVQQPISSPPQNAINVTYHSTRDDNWRCNLRAMKQQKPLLLYAIAFPLFIGFSASHSRNGNFSLAMFAAVTLLAFAFVVSMQFFALKKQIDKRFPTPQTVRVCISSLTPQGFLDITPNKALLIPWRNIKALAMNDGDFYVSLGFKGSFFVPRSAFASSQQGEAFFQAANALWKSQGAQWDSSYCAWHNVQVAVSGGN